MNNFINRLPKAELHVHIIGTLEPELLIRIAKRNSIPHELLETIQKGYRGFNTLETFLKAYDAAASVLKTEEDFYDLTLAYLKKAHSQGVLRSEFFFEVQNFEPLGVSFATIISGIMSAIAEAKKTFNIDAAPLLCFLRNFDEASALHAFKQSLRYQDVIPACGLAAQEQGNPPNKFTHVFNEVRNAGYKVCVHAGEAEGPDYIWQAIQDLHADRIDHGVRCVEDSALVNYLKDTQLPLTVCPISNKLLSIFPPEKHPLKQLLDTGLNVSIHSDDPAFFDGYIAENYAFAHTKMGLTRAELIQCARNSLVSSFASEEEKEMMLEKLEKFVVAQL